LGLKKREARVKTAEKAYEDKVSGCENSMKLSDIRQKPELVAVDTQIAHSVKKTKIASALAERVQRDEERQTESLSTLEQGAGDIRRRMQEAGGERWS